LAAFALQVKGADRLFNALAAYEKGESAASSYASFQAAHVYAGAAEAALALAIGPDRQLSSINKNAKNPATLKVITTKQRVGRGTGPGWLAKAVPGGQWAMVEVGTKPHLIGIPGGRRRPTRRQQGKAVTGFLTGSTAGWAGIFQKFATDRVHLSFGGKAPWGPVYHPGTKGKSPFRRGTRAAEGRAKQVWETTYLTRSIRLLAGGR
jgi:hypothetical protein